MSGCPTLPLQGARRACSPAWSSPRLCPSSCSGVRLVRSRSKPLYLPGGSGNGPAAAQPCLTWTPNSTAHLTASCTARCCRPGPRCSLAPQSEVHRRGMLMQMRRGRRPGMPPSPAVAAQCLSIPAAGRHVGPEEDVMVCAAGMAAAEVRRGACWRAHAAGGRCVSRSSSRQRRPAVHHAS